MAIHNPLVTLARDVLDALRDGRQGDALELAADLAEAVLAKSRGD